MDAQLNFQGDHRGAALGDPFARFQIVASARTEVIERAV